MVHPYPTASPLFPLKAAERAGALLWAAAFVRQRLCTFSCSHTLIND